MTLRGRISGFVVTSALGALSMLMLVGVSVLVSGQHAARVDAVHRRFEAMADLDRNASTYARRLAGVLLEGRGRMPEVQAARIDMERTFALLTRVTRAELASLNGMDEVQGQLPELEDVRRMIELYHAIDAAAARALALARDGDAPGALALYSREVGFRLDNELQPLIDGNLAGERREVADQLDAGGRLRAIMLPATAILALALALILALQGRALFRSVLLPLASARQSLTSMSNAVADDPGHTEFAGFDAAIGHVGERLLKLEAEREALEQRLGEARVQLEGVDAAHAALLAELGHELRTPLTVLRGEADVALRGVPDIEALTGALERIRTEAAELALLLEDMLATARQDPAGQPFEQKRLILQDVVVAAAEEGRVLAAPREVSIRLELSREPIALEGDYRRIKQAIMIGLDNAIRHSAPGSSIGVTAERHGDRARLGIADEGPGIAADDLPHVFERFYRGKGEGELFNQGLGIGLSVARDIVERHGGDVTLANRPEGGALLSIALPALEPRP